MANSNDMAFFLILLHTLFKDLHEVTGKRCNKVLFSHDFVDGEAVRLCSNPDRFGLVV